MPPSPPHPGRGSRSLLLALLGVPLLASGCTGRGSSDGGGGDGDAGVPDTPHCAPVSDWPDEWAALETQVLEFTNIERAEGANCDGDEYPAVGPLTMNAQLRCSSRLHSQDMVDREYFDHTNPDGEGPFDRMADAGFEGFAMGENIAQGATTAAEVVDSWMTSHDHCVNIMVEDFEELGVGYAPSSFLGPLWTQNFGAR